MSCTRCLGRGSGTRRASTHGGCFSTLASLPPVQQTGMERAYGLNYVPSKIRVS